MARTDSKGDYVYPYVPKYLYPAVMYASSLIKKHKTFNVSCKIAANEYGVDEADVRKHVIARANAGKSYAAKRRRGQG